MYFAAQLTRKLKHLFVFLLLFTLLSNLLPPLALAQTIIPSSTYSLGQNNLSQGIPNNQHTLIQSLLLEMTDGLICQLIGIDLLSPKTGCLNIDTVTHKIGYTPGAPSILNGGILGLVSNSIISMYNPPVSSTQYVHYLADNFGLVKHTYAASTIDGIQALSSIVPLWIIARNISYTVFVIAFVFIGIGVMLRIKIDPRTVMTIQNQIPKIVIAILLITFSFAIAGLMVDAMWISTYVGINVVTSATTAGNGTINTNPAVGSGAVPLSQLATQNLYWTPVAYVNLLFDGGLFGLTTKISGAMGTILGDIVNQAFGGNNCSFVPLDLSGCFGKVIIAPLSSLILWIIILIVLLVALFRVWFELLKAYMFILMYVIMGPLWIVASLLPGSPLGFGKWIRSLFANIATFPITVFLFIFARLISDIFSQTPDPTKTFIPPLIGNPNMQAFGTLGALGIILMAPTILNQMRESLKVPGNKNGAAIAAGLGAGSAVAGAVVNKQWANLNKRNSQTGAGEGAISMTTDRMRNWGRKNVLGKIPVLGGHSIKQAERETNKFEGRGFNTNEEYERKTGYLHPENINPLNNGWQEGSKKGLWKVAPTSEVIARNHIIAQLKQEGKPVPATQIPAADFTKYGWTESEKTNDDGTKVKQYAGPETSLAIARERIKQANPPTPKGKGKNP